MEKYNSKKERNCPKSRFRLQTVIEILNKERFISCHSCMFSQIMLMNVAEKIQLQSLMRSPHILEGYKVADKMKEHKVYFCRLVDPYV
jgi:hypothetical protein